MHDDTERDDPYPDQKVVVVDHESVRENFAAGLACDVFEDPQENAAILIVQEDYLAVVAATHGMVKSILEVKPAGPSHTEMYAERPEKFPFQTRPG